jgi:hypothetical protein
MEIKQEWIARYKWDKQKGELLKSEINKKNISYAKVAKPFSRQYIQSLTNAKCDSISSSLISRICNILEIDISIFNLKPMKFHWTKLHGANINQLIKSRRITQAKFTDDCFGCGISISGILFPTKKTIAVNTILTIARFFDLPLESILSPPLDTKIPKRKKSICKKN